jgi:hypothetical protein
MMGKQKVRKENDTKLLRRQLQQSVTFFRVGHSVVSPHMINAMTLPSSSDQG